MFQESLLEMQPGRARGWRRFQALLVAVGCQLVLIAAVLVVPLVWPQPLPLVQAVAAAPKLRPPHVTVHLVEEKSQPVPSTKAIVRAPAPALARVEVGHAGGALRPLQANSLADPAPSIGLGTGMATAFSFGTGSGDGSGFGSSAAPRVGVAPAPSKATAPSRVSEGVTQGHLLAPIQAAYPAIAVAARVSGTVVITATIDRQGRITQLAVASGPELLRSAALDAVSRARYRPFLLNGEATEVLTTISVHFTLGES